MKINAKQITCAFTLLFTSLTAGSLFAKDKAAIEKVGEAVELTAEEEAKAKEKAKELAQADELNDNEEVTDNQ